MKILKFGGTSVGSVEALRNVKSIIGKEFNKDKPLIVVCSALSGITNALLLASQEALKQKLDFRVLKTQLD